MHHKRRSSVKIMGQMILLVRPLIHLMTLAVLLGSAGYLCAIFLTVAAGYSLLRGLEGIPAANIFIGMGIMAVMRGILHYAEQYCNHYIAFRLLALIRHKVFAVLRKLCPAKLEGREKGNLISIITSDIELLEVFYAHTISPVFIAVITLLIMVIFMARYHWAAAVLAAAAYMTVGILIPLLNGRKGAAPGMEFRDGLGKLNSYVLDSLHGIDETLQYGQGMRRRREMGETSCRLRKQQKQLNRMEAAQRSVTNLVILAASFLMLFMTLELYQNGQMNFEGMLICTIAMMGSFGPVTALSNLSNHLNQTLACGERVLSLLEEEPAVEEIPDRDEEENLEFTGAEVQNVTFSYGDEAILSDCTLEIPRGKVTGVFGKSGSGKSTLLKLLMRFWETDQGEIQISGQDVKEIPTRRLRSMQSYVTQETQMFHDSIANNIAVGKPGASREEIVKAAKKASIHDFITSLPDGYDTEVGELGDSLSGGEKQRIGIARAFLHDAPMLLLDEPTSNLDSLNEGIILKSLEEERNRRTVVLVSHRESTIRFADTIYQMESGRMS